jgi:TENA/THI-4/PQQC family
VSGRGAPRFSDELRARAEDVWEAQHLHPVVRAIGDGTLALDAFARYVRQDYLFLIDYARLLALGAARAPDLATMRRFAELAQAILGEEMELHRAFAAELGISEAELEAEEPDGITRGYADFLVRVAATGDFAELAAALLPACGATRRWGSASPLAAFPPTRGTPAGSRRTPARTSPRLPRGAASSWTGWPGRRRARSGSGWAARSRPAAATSSRSGTRP